MTRRGRRRHPTVPPPADDGVETGVGGDGTGGGGGDDDPSPHVPVTDLDRRPTHRVPLVGPWLRRRRARTAHLDAFRRRVEAAYDLERVAATVVRKGIVDPTEDVIEALATLHLSASLDARAVVGGCVPVAETERFVCYYGAADAAPPGITSPLWTLAREASYRQVVASFGSAFAERVEARFAPRRRTLLGKDGWLVLAKPETAWADGRTWTLRATGAPRERYAIRGTCPDVAPRRDYALAGGPLLCRTVGREDGADVVRETDTAAPPVGRHPHAVWEVVAEDFAAWCADARGRPTGEDDDVSSPAGVTGDREDR